MKGYVSEIYVSLQGEGPYNGDRQIFCRLAGCPLRCDYCDTPDSLIAKASHVLSTQSVIHQILALAQGNQVRTVSLTGGEPLTQVEFLRSILPTLRESGLNIYLETAGVHPDALKKIISHVDIVSMDIKLPSATGQVFWLEHERFLKIASSKAFVKIVIQQKSTFEEFDEALRIIQRQSFQPLLILQPASEVNGGGSPPDDFVIHSFFDRARKTVPRVYVIPQLHKKWGVR